MPDEPTSPRVAELPRFSRRLIASLLPSADRASVLVDLDELFAHRVARDGAARARSWYRRECVRFTVRLAADHLGPSGSVGRGLRDSIAMEVRLACRALLHRPRYTVAAVSTLAIGIAAVTTVYSAASWLLARPVPGVHAPNALVTIQLESTMRDGATWPISHPNLVQLAERSRAVSRLVAYTQQDLHLATRSGVAPERVAGEAVSDGYFATLGTGMAAGRAFADRLQSGSTDADVAVVSDALWRRHWNRAMSAVGDRVVLNGRSFTVIGVAPRHFHGAEIPGRTQIWVPGASLPSLIHDPRTLTDPGRQVWSVLIARPHAPNAASLVEREMNAGIDAFRATGGNHSFLATHLVFRAYDGIGLPPLQRERMRGTLQLLGAAATLLLLLTCANVANLGLVRAVSMRTSTAVRRALGAGLGRLVRERLVESLIVGALGAIAGTLLSVILVVAIRGLRVAGIELDIDMSALDGGVIAAAVLVSLAAGCVVGALPAWSVRGEDGSSLLRAARHGDARAARVRRALVIAQVALSVVLVVSAGLLARTLWNLRHVELGVSTGNVLTFSVDPELQGYDARRTARLIDDMVRQLRDDARVEAASVVDFAPFTSMYIPANVARTDASADERPISARGFRVSPEFFAVLRLPITGEGFSPASVTERDSTASEVAVLNVEAARTLFPGITPATVVGRTIWRPRFVGGAIGRPRPGDKLIRVVGIVPDARLSSVTRPAQPAVFRPWSQGYQVGRFTAYVRTRVPPHELASVVRDVMRRLDPALPVYEISTLDDDVARLVADQRLAAVLACTLGAVALLLAAVGLYALLAYAVVERRREIGIRSALGALPRTVVASVMRGGLRLTAIGLTLGLVGAMYVSRFVESRLFGVQRLDVATYAAGVVVMLCVAGAASFIPAYRAMRVDVVDVLRNDP